MWRYLAHCSLCGTEDVVRACGRASLRRGRSPMVGPGALDGFIAWSSHREGLRLAALSLDWTSWRRRAEVLGY